MESPGSAIWSVRSWTGHCPVRRSVLAPGGGWVAQPGRLEQAKSGCLILYIKVMVLTAVKRVSGDTSRPLLLTDDPVERMRDPSEGA